MLQYGKLKDVKKILFHHMTLGFNYSRYHIFISVNSCIEALLILCKLKEVSIIL